MTFLCTECFSPANIVCLFTRKHYCGRACLAYGQHQVAKLLVAAGRTP